MKTPYKHQAQYLPHMSKVTKLPLFWQMRLGKSPQVIWWLKSHHPNLQRVLIICPKSVIVSWKEELEDFRIDYVIFSTKNKELHEKFISFPFWVLTNYETLISDNIELHKHPWEAVILDESDRIRNPKSRTSHRISHPSSFPLQSPDYPQFKPVIDTQLRACLAGTPAPESLLEYFQQFRFIYGKMGRYQNFWQYRKDLFYTSSLSPGKYLPRPHATKAIAKYLDDHAFILTRKAIGRELPNIYEKRFVELASKAKKVYDEYEKNWYSDFLHSLIKEGGLHGQTPKQIETKWAMTAQAFLHQLACGYVKIPETEKYFQAPHKLNELVSLIRGDLLEEKIIIWCRFLLNIKAIKEKLEDLRYKGLIEGRVTDIQGSTTNEQIEKRIKDFRTNKIQYLICQTRKAGRGMDFSSADTQIFFSRSWSALDNEQATDRLVHPGKKKCLLTVDIITENTIDEDLYHARIEKKANANVYKYFLKRLRQLGNLNENEISEMVS